MTGPDLKPCPFCGGNNVRAFRHVPMQPDPCVMCRDCYASAASVAAWNTRDPAVLAALPEVQALIAAAYEVAAKGASDAHAKNEEQRRKWANPSIIHADDIAETIRALPPAEAIAALAARDAAMIARGMREAAEWYRAEGWKIDEDDVLGTILARAAEIEGGGK